MYKTSSRLLRRAVMRLLAFAVAACGAASGADQRASNPGAATLPTAALAGTHPRAEAELAMLLAGVQVPAGAEQVTSAPVPFLAEAPATEGSPNLLMRTSWWRIDMPFADVLAWIQAHPPGGLTSESRVVGAQRSELRAWSGTPHGRRATLISLRRRRCSSGWQ